MFLQCDKKWDFWILPSIQSEIFCHKAVFVACSLFSYESTDSEFINTYEQATRTALILIILLRRQGLEQRKVLKERVFMMFSFFGESNWFSFQNLAAFEVIGTKAKSSSDDVVGHGTALLKISGHYSIEMSIFVVCWIWSFLGIKFQYIIWRFHFMLKL